MDTLTTASVIGAVLFLGLVALAWFVARYGGRDDEDGHWLDDRWADVLRNLNGPAEWDGTTWELPEAGSYGEWFTPEHDPETVSFAAWQGPEPEYDQGQLGVDVDAYIARMEADTTQFIAQIHAIPYGGQLALVGSEPVLQGGTIP